MRDKKKCVWCGSDAHTSQACKSGGAKSELAASTGSAGPCTYGIPPAKCGKPAVAGACLHTDWPLFFCKEHLAIAKNAFPSLQVFKRKPNAPGEPQPTV